MVTHQLTRSGNESSVEVSDGDVIVIELREQATAGYAWQVTQPLPGVDVTLQPLAGGARGAGASASARVTITVHEASDGELVLRHRQAWSPADDDESFRLKIQLKK